MKRLFQCIIGISTALICQFAVANTEVDIPEVIEVISVDGKDLGFRLLNQPESLTLAPGEHVLELRYKDLFEDDEGAHAVIKSVPLYIRFAAIQNGEFSITLDEPEDEEEAEKFAKNPKVALINKQDGQPVVSRQVTQVKQQQNWLANLLALPDSEEVYEAPSGSAVATPDPATAVPATKAGAVVTTPAGKLPQEASPKALEMLRYWWQEADVETRQAFIKEILSQ
ncbi:DUF2057 domain-containing protein [Corallincola platygyrae]|uniref:DUF2057 domain-containing protein n=1 Tax=Corallincola platygyrae TaxID=1193278 RepID=A0ABW4XR91_9GAMM